VSFMRVKRSEGRGRGGKPAATSPAVNYSRFTQLDAADDNGGVALGGVDEAHGCFTRLWYSWPPIQRGDWLIAIWPPCPPTPTASSGNLQTWHLPLLLFTTMTPREVNTPAANYCHFKQPDVNHWLCEGWRLLDCLWSLTHSSRAIENGHKKLITSCTF